ncbi:hypothetical protein [Priestia aryabhattai]|uniref:hypothetical protein n=1 Tax=Priestia aryabhattai TaxID=412384 RepID=UPI001AD982C9|nr:hypothetical protein [Priestia aryabhattai]QTL51423.1 hypothetical protein J5Z55_10250 [Priestia aryabhattai]
MYSGENIKIGARILTEKQATILLPNYPLINNQIAQFREEAKNFNENWQNTNLDNYLRSEIYSNFDNVISILGERGSGKTSVFLTLKYMHHAAYKNDDIILPLIVPDNMGDTSDAMGWIISYLEKEVKDLHPLLKINERKDMVYNGLNSYNGLNKCIENEDSELKEQFKQLRNTYEIRKKVYLNKILERDEGTKEYINDKARMTHADQSLMVDFDKFINTLIKAKKKVNPNKDREPLILMFFDDVDISAHRCPEVLETIRNYLNHPNIVVFVSGDFKVFSEIVCLEFLRKEGVTSDDYHEVFIPSQQLSEKGTKLFSALELRKERSQEYLKKVLPPSFRFYMKKLNDNDKSNFSYEFVEGNKLNGPTLSELLSKIESNGNKLIWGMKDSDINVPINNVKIPHAFFEVFDDNPRGLINPYYYLYQKVHLNKSQTWHISDIKHFLQIILNSSVKLQQHKKNIEDIIVINEVDQSVNNLRPLVYINYDLFLDLFLQESENNKDENLILEEFRTLYILCVFFDKLINLVIPNYSRYSNHSVGNLLSRILNYKTDNLFPNIDNDDLLLQMYSAFDNKILLNSNKIFKNADKGTKNLEQMYFETLMKSVSVDTDEYIGKRDRKSTNLIRLLELLFQKDENWVIEKITFIKNSGKSYNEIHHDVIQLLKEELSFLDEATQRNLMKKHLPNKNKMIKKETISKNLIDHFIKSHENYSEVNGMLHVDMKRFIKAGLNLEQLLQQRDTLNKRLDNLKERGTLVINQLDVTVEELKNIKDQENLIETRKKMLNKIKDLETYTQDELRKKEWNLFKNSFNIAQELSKEKWIDENGLQMHREPVIVFDPRRLSLQYKELIQDNLDSLTRVGLFVKDQHVLTRKEIINFIEKYFIEEQESLLLKAHLPLDVEGRIKQVENLEQELNFLNEEVSKIEADQYNIEGQLENIYAYSDFEVDDSSNIYGILQKRFKEYLLSSIDQQLEVILRHENLEISTKGLVEILKIYEESIKEAKSLLSNDQQFEDLEEFTIDEGQYIRLNQVDRDFLSVLLRRERHLSVALINAVSPLRNKDVNELRPSAIKEIISELEKLLNEEDRSFTLNFKERTSRVIRNLKEYTTQPSSTSENKDKLQMIILSGLNEIIRPYIYVKILIEDRRINEENSTVYFRTLKEQLTNFVLAEIDNKHQTRFVRFLEKTLSVE